MKPVRVFHVIPSLPEPLEPLRELAYNLRWAWDHDSIELFRRLDSDLWESTGHNPVQMLGSIDQMRLVAAAADDSFLAHLERVSGALLTRMEGQNTWFRRVHAPAGKLLVAYFSAEFGLTECLSIFAGGLGVLAGDHVKSASDLGVPLVGVGLLYQQGYFRQYLSQAGWQQEEYANNDFHNLPLRQLTRPDGKPLTIEIQYPGRVVTACIWWAQAGRVPVYLLDTNLAANSPADREITGELYGGDNEMRIKQEILLGIGGYRALEAAHVQPAVYHMNEGHSSFLSLEHVRRLMERYQLSFAEARELASPSLIFTGHTPVEAGHDYFAADLMDRYFAGYTQSLGLSRRDFLALGRRNADDPNEAFCMTILALRLAAASNGVSKLHGEVSRRMWQGIWPGVPAAEVPIGHVTNGVHYRSWISHEMNELYDRYLGPQWRDTANGVLWKRIDSIPGEELWRTHERRRERLVAFARRKLSDQLRRRGAPQSEIEAAGAVLDTQALTIGFARRFATYKRATLLLRDTERLKRILCDPKQPVQIIYAGKAHPRDAGGKELIQRIVTLARDPAFRRHIVFLEDQDMAISRYLVQGCDVWLNTPLRPLEASGTSGMKAAANGALNLSTLDGWWDEAWQAPRAEGESIGWAIGNGEAYSDPGQQDLVEAEALYDLLERDVVPAFYELGPDRLPRRWIALMKGSLKNVCHIFNTHRMVREYTERFYLPAFERFTRLEAESAAGSRALAAWMSRVKHEWPQVRVEALEEGPGSQAKVGDLLCVRARLRLGALSPADVTAELYLGALDAAGELLQPATFPMRHTASPGDGAHIFEATGVPCCRSGLQGYTVRVLPHHPDLAARFVPGLISWAS
ncbi:MAG TPA: alpha-glucan family phosphorylase [Bryobacteraceae bacterium]|nr:alpha-glucan family phosphorylase [Bryobacteraceae bacterium]